MKISIPDHLKEMYLSGMSMAEICASSEGKGITISTLRLRLLDAGILRTTTEAVKLAAKKGKLGPRPGFKREPFSPEWRHNISLGKLKYAETHAKGLSYKAGRYITLTRGPDKDRSQHRVLMEAHLGRKLPRNELVHHKDEVKTHNDIDNLEVMTIQEHSRLHAIQRYPKLPRGVDGRWQKVLIA